MRLECKSTIKFHIYNASFYIFRFSCTFFLHSFDSICEEKKKNLASIDIRYRINFASIIPNFFTKISIHPTTWVSTANLMQKFLMLRKQIKMAGFHNTQNSLLNWNYASWEMFSGHWLHSLCVATEIAKQTRRVCTSKPASVQTDTHTFHFA